MSFPISSVTDLIATTIQKRSKKIADNVTKNNAVLAKLSASGKVKTFSGGNVILEELSFAENGNAGWYAGYDVLPVATQDVIGAAQYNIKQAACPVIVSGLELLQNSGPEKMIDLVEARIEVAESTMKNLVTAGIYSDGSGSAAKQLDGLKAAVPDTNTSGTYGGIDCGAFTFWQSKAQSRASDGVQVFLNKAWAQCVRGADRPDLIVLGTTYWSDFVNSLQLIQRFTSPESATLGFPTLKYMDADVVLDNVAGISATEGYMLNSKYLRFRPHADRNFVALNPGKRYAINQDAEVQILGFAGNLTVSNRSLQCKLKA